MSSSLPLGERKRSVSPAAGGRVALTGSIQEGSLSKRALYELLERVSRTFALSNRMLPRRFRDPMTVAYLLFRVSDYLEDNPVLRRQEKAAMLRTWERVLAGAAPYAELEGAMRPLPWEDGEAEVARRFRQLLENLESLQPEVCEAIRRRARETTRGMELWQHKGPRIRTEAELDEYMHYVAGIVGLMITEVFSSISITVRCRRRQLLPLSREYGLGLQTVNILRGVRKDRERGWIFIPEEFCREAGIAPEELFNEKRREESLLVIDRLVSKAERHLREGLCYVLALPRSLYRVRVAAMWPLMFAARTLSIARANPAVLRDEAKMGRRDVMRILRHTVVLGWSDRWVEHYFDQLLR
ncbi:MAG: squalene/phytoene synthase family protein [Alkalispirochaetaceae bacterium]